MTHPNTTREVLIAEALWEAAKLIRQVEALAPALDESRQALADAHSRLAGQLAAFETHILALTEKSKVVTTSRGYTEVCVTVPRNICFNAMILCCASRNRTQKTSCSSTPISSRR